MRVSWEFAVDQGPEFCEKGWENAVGSPDQQVRGGCPGVLRTGHDYGLGPEPRKDQEVSTCPYASRLSARGES